MRKFKLAITVIAALLLCIGVALYTGAITFTDETDDRPDSVLMYVSREAMVYVTQHDGLLVPDAPSVREDMRWFSGQPSYTGRYAASFDIVRAGRLTVIIEWWHLGHDGGPMAGSDDYPIWRAEFEVDVVEDDRLSSRYGVFDQPHELRLELDRGSDASIEQFIEPTRWTLDIPSEE